MSSDPVVAGVLDIVAAWEQEAVSREQRAPGVPDPVAATLKTSAADMRARIEQVQRDTAYLSVSDYARLHGSSEQTVRRLCAAGLLEGAEKNTNEDWRIPRNAKRRVRSA